MERVFPGSESGTETHRHARVRIAAIPVAWTDADIDNLKAMHKQNLTYHEIAMRTGRSRSSVASMFRRIRAHPEGTPSKRRPPTAVWTNEEIEQLRKLRAEGRTHAQIGAVLGKTATTVNLMIMKIGGRHALGSSTSAKKSRPVADRFIKPEDDNRPPVSLKNIPHESASTAVSLFDVGPSQWRWPLNDVNPIHAFRFCGAHATGAWCPAHAARGGGRKMECAG